MTTRNVGPFTLLSVHRQGRSSDVYLAEDRRPGAEPGARVAVKVFKRPDAEDSECVDRFLKEAQTLARFGPHPHLVGVVGFDRLGKDEAWMAMEFIPRSLSEVITAEPARERDVIRMIRHIAEALDRLHLFERQPVLHGDVKPANILVAGEGDRACYKLADLGGAAVRSSVEHLLFAPPEHLGDKPGQASPAADLYSLGVVAYKMLLGERLFAEQVSGSSSGDAAGPRQIAQWAVSSDLKLKAPADVLPGVSKELSDVIARMMDKRQSERFQSAGEVLKALPGLDEERLPAPPRPVPWFRRPSTMAAGACAIIGGLAGVLLLLRPVPTLELPGDGRFAAQGSFIEVHALARHLPRGAKVDVLMPDGSSVPLHAAAGPVTPKGSRRYAGRVSIASPGEVHATVRIVSASRAVVAEAPVEVERQPPAVVLLETSPPRASMPLLVRGPDGSTTPLTTDEDGRARFQGDPGEYAVEGQDARYVVAPSSRRLAVPAGERSSSTLQLWSRFGLLHIKVDPPDAAVTLAREGAPEERFVAADGAAEREVEATEWRLLVSAEGYLPEERTVEVRRGQRAEVDLRLAKVPPPRPVEPPPTDLAAVRDFVLAHTPLSQVSLNEVALVGRLRLTGVLLNQAELDLARARLTPVADHLIDEFRIDPEATARLVARRLREEGGADVRARVIGGGAGLYVQVRATPACPPDRCLEIARGYVMRPEHLSLRLGAD